MPRGQREIAGLRLDGGNNNREPSTTRSRRALGDVSNKESERASNKRGTAEHASLRRSTRLSHEPEASVTEHYSNQGDDAPELAQPVARRQSLRSSQRSRAASTAVNPFAEPRPQVARKRAQRRDNESKPGETSRNTKRARATSESSSSAKRTRKTSTNRPLDEFAIPATPKAVPLLGENLYVDILQTNNHCLVRRQFSDRQFVAGTATYDLENIDNPLHVPTYATDIYQRLYDAEEKSRPEPYMETTQPELNSSMRGILVDWLVEVHTKFRLLPETLYLCVNIIDRYLQLEEVCRNKLQLVGVTALLIACKYEEIYPPEVRDCVYITDRAYTRQDVLDMEATIVKTLKFTLTVPTGHPFLQRFLHVVKATSVVRNLANYYMERMLQEHTALRFKPSLLAVACTCLALNHPDRSEYDDGFDGDAFSSTPAFPPSLLEYSCYEEEAIREAAALIVEKVRDIGSQSRRRPLVAVKVKFESTRYDEVASTFSWPEVSHLDRVV